MLGALLLSVGLFTATPDLSDQDQEVYRQAAARAGRDAEAHVNLALWCEQRGLDHEALKHLAIAVLADPTNARARGLLGLVHDHGAWRKPEAVSQRVLNDEQLASNLAEYNRRRAKIDSRDPDDHWKLALWCDENGLEGEATAELTAVTRLEPSREAAWKRLGYQKHHNRWMTPEQIQRQVAEIEAQTAANKQWLKDLTEWKQWLQDAKHEELRRQAEQKLAEVSDPRAIPALWKVFADENTAHQLTAVQLLGQIDSPQASPRLALLAVMGNTDEVRRRATETLVWRDPREFVGLLVSGVRTPSKYLLNQPAGPGTPAELLVEGERFNIDRVYQSPRLPEGGEVSLDPTASIQRNRMALQAYWRLVSGVDSTPLEPGLALALAGALANPGNALAGVSNAIAGAQVNAQNPGVSGQAAIDQATVQNAVALSRRNQLEYMRAVAATQQQIVNDVASLEQGNLLIRWVNSQILPVLKVTTGESLGEDSDAWKTWWADRQGYAYEPPAKPTFVQVAPASYTPDYVAVHTACFARGTLVRTLQGLTPIETLRTGDMVLSQNENDGELSFQPIVAVFHNPPNETLRLRLESSDSPIVATLIHRFWIAGRGWVMARDLKPGDEVRTVGGTVSIAEIVKDKVQPVFNLEVGRNHSFFVGSKRPVLVHDNSLVDPASTPFDAAPSLEVTAR